jgi:hypothetical protein
VKHWKIGDKALCLDDSEPPLLNYSPDGNLEKGSVYTVDGFSHQKELGLILREKPTYDKNMEPVGWRAKRFKRQPRLPRQEAVEN